MDRAGAQHATAATRHASVRYLSRSICTLRGSPRERSNVYARHTINHQNAHVRHECQSAPRVDTAVFWSSLGTDVHTVSAVVCSRHTLIPASIASQWFARQILEGEVRNIDCRSLRGINASICLYSIQSVGKPRTTPVVSVRFGSVTFSISHVVISRATLKASRHQCMTSYCDATFSLQLYVDYSTRKRLLSERTALLS